MNNLLTDKQNGVCTLTLNRPEVRNAVDGETMIALKDAILACDEHSDVRVVVITGANGAFSSGADIAAAIKANVTPAEAYSLLTGAYAPALKAIRSCPWPVIAAVDGMAAG